VPPLPWIDFSGRRPLGLAVFAWAALAGATAGGLAAVAIVRRRGWPLATAVAFCVFVGAASWIGAHLLAVVAYHGEVLKAAPLKALTDVTNGTASAGGVVAGALAALAFARLARRPPLDALDATGAGVLVALALGRVGCALVHDHPGVPWPWFPSVDAPGGPRLDLGLLEAAACVVLAPFALRRAFRAAPGAAARVFLLGYAPVRFVLDAFRLSPETGADLAARGFVKASDLDPRHAALTAAQWACLAFVAGGLLLLRRRRRA